MKIRTELLIEDLIERTKQHMNQAEELKQLGHKQLNWKENPESWSVLECLEHLNLYGDFYLPEIESSIENSQFPGQADIFKSGLLGNYFAKAMLPKEKLNKMKTFKDKNPGGSKLNISTLDRFIEQQRKMLALLDKARQINITKTKTAISISNLIKLRLGDTFRVVIYHNQRHLLQATKTINKQKRLAA